MLPLERFFNEQMDEVLRMLNADDAYWSGFAFGLLGFFGSERPPVSHWHESMLFPGNASHVAQGYRDGMRAMTNEAGGRVPYRSDAPATEPARPVS